ncbi:hypothetical protein NCG89_02915 [Spongiibacter taiwanensis]|uniref:hypothetical protein n=1 Tax=Spongiibacter taiwanensis TaxID=1748242 RepID=UPI00203582D6|nr:hypothetical protein [Spongiibacter taiwanensis]USA43747.1 hypothetical protein NCG89_02915 [Spongiibacter taiwanensis]
MSLHFSLESETQGRPLRELQSTDNLLVICIRLWAQEHGHFTRTPSAPDWRSGFKAVGLTLDAERSFHAFLGLIFTACRPAPSVKYYACPIASRGEYWLLACASLAQRQKWTQLDSCLGDRLSQQHRHLAISLLKNLSHAMLDAGLHLSPPQNAGSDVPLHIYRSASLAAASQTLH